MVLCQRRLYDYSGSVTKHALFAPPQVVHTPQMAKASMSAQSSLSVHELHSLGSLTQKVRPSTDVAQNPDPLLQRGTLTPQELPGRGTGRTGCLRRFRAPRSTARRTRLPRILR